MYKKQNVKDEKRNYIKNNKFWQSQIKCVLPKEVFAGVKEFFKSYTNKNVFKILKVDI